MQYIAIRPLTTFVALVSELFGVYYTGSYKWGEAYLYLMVLNSLSQMTALYFLTLFYLTFKDELKAMKPLSKFLCIKFVIFLTFL